MKIPILSGIYTDADGNFLVSYPRNLNPVVKETGINQGYLRPSEGIIEEVIDLSGVSNGAIDWNGVHYRMMGSKLIKINEDKTTQEIFNTYANKRTRLNYSFDYLSFSNNGNLYLYDGTATQQITDPDLGTVIDHVWIDGYFLFTDGEFLGVTELNDPFSVLPTKYGSSELDPDPIKAVLILRNEPYALNRYTIEAFRNVGGTGFPFVRISGAQILKGTVGTFACTVFDEYLAFVGSGRNESPSVYLSSAGSYQKIGTEEIDKLLKNYTEAELADVVVEARLDEDHKYLYIHLPDQSVVYDLGMSLKASRPVWFFLTSGVGKNKYRSRDMLWIYNKWYTGDTLKFSVGSLTESLSSHWGVKCDWEFSTLFIYNDGKKAIVHDLELVCLSGRSQTTDDATVSTQYSTDGLIFSTEKAIRAGNRGQYDKRLKWYHQGMLSNYRLQRFKGTSDSHLTISRLEANIEGLAW